MFSTLRILSCVNNDNKRNPFRFLECRKSGQNNSHCFRHPTDEERQRKQCVPHNKLHTAVCEQNVSAILWLLSKKKFEKDHSVGNTSKRAWKVRMRVRHEESGWWDMVENYFPWIHWGQQEWESPAMLSTPQAHRFLRSSWGPVSTSHSWVLSTRTMLQQVSCHHGIPT